ncbi:hypothetical protein GGTG_08276 [Gaeumannomyces tritici R3-111a-1]|uniref:beta-glucosidase n=1 Tax=Gaeumannomyces tritici (strain R3-111a-1) TaxID=644352 RepID=J3P439_GAET3|nr:hypothetical protein GGTG_08276 [Gaeumannomyces tritici R3-111a-1]EJT74435.1 hypothetical protein GGTG_08276 [Gaeumannomyces tritici R3-111a-1]
MARGNGPVLAVQQCPMNKCWYCTREPTSRSPNRLVFPVANFDLFVRAADYPFFEDICLRSTRPHRTSNMGSELHARSPDELDYDGATPDTEVFTPVNPYGPGDVLGGTKDKKRLLAREKLVRLSLEEKRTKVIPSKGIPSAKTSDGPNGARGGIFVGGTKAALFPCGISLAATWNKSLLRDIGRHLASEAKARSANILLAPTVCLHRHPLGRRNFESFSEDPVLTGKLAAQYIGELQEKGVAATIIKHFVGNEKETNRLTIDSRISERPLQEIYLRPFEIAVREANPWAIMTSYNLVNETHADMHENVLKDILRGEWGYDGAGCDIGFPFSTKWRFEKLLTALEKGKLSLQDIDRAAENALALVQRVKGDDMSAEQEEREEDRPATHMEAGKAVELRVEMTNELRPAAKQKEFNMTHKYGGCRIGFKEEDTVDYLQQAVDAARAADVAVIIVSLDAEWESEGYDRQTMDLPSDGSQDRLIEAVLDANPRTVVVDQSGSPVTMPWADRVPAILRAWHQGQEAGNALADVLFGRKCPSGKLPCTFPRRLQDTPAYHNWPGENLEVVYGEGVYVGYRHYERVRIAPLFPFGHGLSYTSFEYGRPSLSGRALSGPDDVLELVLGVTLAGAETVQVYVADERSRLPRPRKGLAAFEKVFLEADETKHLRIHIDRFAVGYYDTSVSRWVAGEGRFNVLTGASSADIRHQISFDVTQTFSWVF